METGSSADTALWIGLGVTLGLIGVGVMMGATALYIRAHREELEEKASLRVAQHTLLTRCVG